MLSTFSQAWASWKTAPGVALLAVVAFAIGIGSATAIFTVINAGYPPLRLIVIGGSATSAGRIRITAKPPVANSPDRRSR